ncbi:glycosyltransferase family 2 protein [Mucilaginibacter paludis]|uniref:Glycosyl transferase family 2 n=1 Tax=Mucilaginibacter paludis DSM 18603 TaxID=714943 RepID=H1YG98_9SPHI|nr:glycosyltransferase [Mucilaginibacter paludis]EHQ27362.1 glycosyl transferase family 2 [Mucilaginibacter paludis DSM 18603]
METSNPQITVLMPAYNAADYIAPAIQSVLDQTFIDFELLIINDGSTDDTLAVINTFDDQRIVVITQPNGGVACALNTGLIYARAPYIARFDADDICYPKRLETQYDFMVSNPEYDILGSAVDYTDMHGQHVFNFQPPAYSNEQIRQLNYTVCPFIHSSVFYKKEVIIGFGGYDKSAYSFEDHLLWRNILRSVKAFNFSQPLIKVRLNPESITIDEKWRSREFRRIKYTALKNGYISAEEGQQLKAIGKMQGNDTIKHGAYHALLGKKFLWNNHQPLKARENLKKVIVINRLDWKSYILFLLSFLPANALLKLYNVGKFKAMGGLEHEN